MPEPETTTRITAAEIMGRLQEAWVDLSPELQKSARFLLENPNEVGVNSIRQLAAKADVKPNTLVRLSHALGMESYESFREIFRDEIRQGRETYPDRARWLQSLSQRGELGGLYGTFAETAIDNLEGFFAATDHAAIEQVAQAIVAARRTYVLGVGVNNGVAHNFAYLVSMAINGVRALPNGGTQLVDGLARAGRDDLLIAITFHPYRTEIVDAIEVARARETPFVAISDSPASPIMPGASHSFVIPTETPQFFISTVALTAFFEVLTAFVIAAAGESVVSHIEEFHSRRHALGVYVEDKEVDR